MDSKRAAFALWFLITLLAISLLLARGCSISTDRNAPKLERGLTIQGLKGSIISADGYTLVASKRLYSAQIDLRSLDFGKLDYFLKLYQIYSFSSDKEISQIKKKLLAAHKRGVGNFVLSNTLDERAASYLGELSRKLYTQGFFKAFKTSGGKVLTSALDIIENKEQRIFPKGDILTPILGYSTYDSSNTPVPKKGLEKYYEDCLRAQSDYKIIGAKDIGKHIIIDKNSFKSQREDGCKLHLAINLKLQKGLENIATAAQKTYGAKQIIIGLMQGKDAKLLALATSKRYDPYNRKSDLSFLNTDAAEYAYEPGSVIKPIVFANLLKANKVNTFEQINTHNGRMKLDRFYITDTHPAASMIAEDIIVHSSNIGMVELSNRQSAQELISGLADFGIGEFTGIDLPYEARGWLKDPKKTYEIEKNTMAYGYGFKSTFIQLLAAYNVFLANGNWQSPKIARAYELGENGIKEFKNSPSRTVLDVKTAKQIRRILIKTANQKSLARYWPLGISVGGKTGTARASGKRGYTSEYNANFFGFASDGANAYTVGILVISPDPRKKGYYAAQTAVPIAASVINQLVDDGFLVPKYDD